MKDEQYRFMSVFGQLPARLTAEQTAWVLNCQVHDIPALVNAKLLKPLGTPSANSIKFYATSDLLNLVKDRNWLVRSTNTIYQHWQRRNRPAPSSGITPPRSLTPPNNASSGLN